MVVTAQFGDTVSRLEAPAWHTSYAQRLLNLERQVRETQTEAREVRAQMQDAKALAQSLERRVAQLEAAQRKMDMSGRGGGAARRRQQQEVAPAVNTSVVHLHRVTATMHGPGFGYSTISLPALRPLPLDAGSGHRRVQQACTDLSTRIAAVNAQCCDEPTEDRGSGVPLSCNAGCAQTFLPFWADCSSQLGPSPAFLGVVAQCQATAAQASSGAQTGGLVHEFNLVCPGSAVSGCVPRQCTSTRRSYAVERRWL